MKTTLKATLRLLPFAAALLLGCDHSHDHDAPPVPAGVYSVTGDGWIEILWSEVRVEDLAGYRVYRGDSAAGAAVRFHDLDEPSRRLVSRLLTNFAQEGGPLWQLPPPAPAEVGAVEPEPMAPGEAAELFSAPAEIEIGADPEELEAIPPQTAQPQAGGAEPTEPSAGQEPAAPQAGGAVFDLTSDAASGDAPVFPGVAEAPSGEPLGKVEIPPIADLFDMGQDSGDDGGAELTAAPAVLTADIAQVAEVLGVTRERVRQIEARAMRRLRYAGVRDRMFRKVWL